MKQYSLPYGNEHRTIEIPSTLACVTVSYEGADIDTNREAAISTIRQAMSSPIGAIPLRDMAAFSGNAVIMISDGSRLCPSDLILPAILDELNAAGVPDRAVTIMTALGMHRKHTEDELKRLTGEAVFERVRVINHSPLPEDCVSLGSTTLGTPVEVHRVVAEAALRIAVGNIEPHGLVGVSGGAKAVMPGTASRHAIESHHALTQRYPPQPGSLDHPLRKDIEEVLSFVPLH